jgi:outer membrane lipoprotein-sorting protein
MSRFVQLVRNRLCVALALSTFAASINLYAQSEMTAEEILDVMTETMNPQQSKGIMRMTVVTTSGQERTFEYRTLSKNGGEKSLMKYLKPTRVKDQAILMLNDANDIWVYFPRTRRVRKLATHAKRQKLEGSDFSYEDMGASNTFVEEYRAIRHDDEKRDGRRCYVLELTRTPESTAGYSRVWMWVDKEYLVPLLIRYYHDEDSALLEKELVCRDIQLIDEIYTPMKYTMHNKLDNTQTSLEIVEVTYDVELPDDLFTEMGMQK